VLRKLALWMLELVHPSLAGPWRWRMPRATFELFYNQRVTNASSTSWATRGQARQGSPETQDLPLLHGIRVRIRLERKPAAVTTVPERSLSPSATMTAGLSSRRSRSASTRSTWCHSRERGAGHEARPRRSSAARPSRAHRLAAIATRSSTGWVLSVRAPGHLALFANCRDSEVPYSIHASSVAIGILGPLAAAGSPDAFRRDVGLIRDCQDERTGLFIDPHLDARLRTGIGRRCCTVPARGEQVRARVSAAGRSRATPSL